MKHPAEGVSHKVQPWQSTKTSHVVKGTHGCVEYYDHINNDTDDNLYFSNTLLCTLKPTHNEV